VPFLGDIPVVQYLFAKQVKRDFRKSVLILLTPRRVHYVNQDPEERAKTAVVMSDFEKTLDEFEQRNKNWFAPYSTLSQIMRASPNNSLFNEFKTGDFMLETWNTRNSHKKRLKKATDFLFY